MNTLPGISVYNQSRLDDDNFVANFVARTNELEQLLDELRAMARSGESRHTIIVGSRGMGKSTLLRRTAIAVNRERALSKAFMPLPFREEQYNVISLDAFWRNCGEALAEWCEQTGHNALADELDRAVLSSAWRSAEKSEAEFLRYCKQLRRRPLLLLDNLDIILDGLKEKDNWTLRRTLQAKNGPVVVGGATRLLAQGGNREAPFYEFFYPQILEPLSEAELLSCMRALASQRGEAGERVSQLLAREPERIRTLYALTGGNPRVLALIYQLLERAETGSIFEDLEVLLDQVTPFYKARVEEYQSPQQRAVIDAIALNWDPIGSRALAKATGLEITTISSQLNRLRKDGLVEEVPSSGARSSYQLSERFLNIWYLMRHGTRRTRQRLRWLTLFLVRLFSADEIHGMAQQARSDDSVCNWTHEYREAVIAAHELADTKLQHSGPFRPERQIVESDTLEDVDVKQALEYLESGNYAEASSHLEKLVRATGDETDLKRQTLSAWALMLKGIALEQVDRTVEALAAYDELLARFSEAEELPLRETVAIALISKGFMQGLLERPEEELKAYEEVLARFSEAEELLLREQVAKALIFKSFVVGKLERPAEELKTYDEVIARFGEAEELPLREQVASALVYKGDAFGQLDRFAEALKVYDEVIARFGEAEELPLLEQVAKALVSKGVAFRLLDRIAEALTVYDEVIARFGEAEELPLCEQVAKALVGKGLSLGYLDRPTDALAVCEEVLARFGEAEELPLRVQEARALVYKGIVLGQLDRTAEALTVYDEVIARFGAAEELPLREQVAWALDYKGATLGQLDRPEEALKTYDEVIGRFGNTEELRLREQVAWALVYKGAVLGQLDRPAEALKSYDQVIARFSDSKDLGLLEQVATAFGYKGNFMLDHLGNPDEAESAYREGLRVSPNNLFLQANLAWAIMLQSKEMELSKATSELKGLDSEGLLLLDSAMHLMRDNFGLAMEKLSEALDFDLKPSKSDFFEDILRLLKLAVKRKYGEQLIEWFEETGNHDKYAPCYVALIAYQRGERFLNDANPEVRVTARKFFEFLRAPDLNRVKET